jgi:hypothetical protein
MHLEGTFTYFLIKTLYVFSMNFGVVFRSVPPLRSVASIPEGCVGGAQGGVMGRVSVYKYELLGGFRGLKRQPGGFEEKC